MSEYTPDSSLLHQLDSFSMDVRGDMVETDQIDTYDELLDLEHSHTALDYIQSRYSLPDLTPKERALASILNPTHGVNQIGNQFAIKLLDVYLQNDPDTALTGFRSIQPTTTEEEMALLIDDQEFRQIHADTKVHLIEQGDAMHQEVIERLDPKKGAIAINDRLQFNGNETARSLRQVLRRGINVQFMPDGIPQIETALEKVGTGPLPLTEVLKNERIVSINGFPESKVSLAVHDAIDHAWAFNLLDKKGLIRKYAEFFDSIGNPAYTDIFRREGEIVASIGFGVRYGSVQENGFAPLVSAEDIRDIFEGYFNDGSLDERHMHAFRILRKLEANSREANSLGFTYSNYIAELNEQRRKHGKIKVRDLQSREITGELSEVDPDFLSLFVELHHEIVSSDNKHRNDLFRYHILFEEYLQGIAHNAVDAQEQPFNVRIQDMSSYSYDKTTVPTDRLHWMAKNYGFTATKGQVY
jgi:hypothetical protein